MSTGRYEGATIAVAKWEKYNPRGDVKRPSWFRLENDTALGPEFFGLDSDQKWLWVVILSLTSQRNGDPFVWNCGFIQANTGISPGKQEATLEFLEKTARITVERNAHVTPTFVGRKVTRTKSHATERDGTGRDGTNGTERNGTERESDEKSDSGLPPLVEIWNKQKHPGLPAVEKMNPAGKRYRACVARWEANPDPAYWSEVIARINRSQFCLGANDRGWKADIEFLCRPDSAEKVLEGKYDRGGGQPGGVIPSVAVQLDPETERMERECEAILRGFK